MTLTRFIRAGRRRHPTRHMGLEEGIATTAEEARLYCNLITSYVLLVGRV